MGPSPTTTRAALVVFPGFMPYVGVHSKVALAKAMQARSMNIVWAMLLVDYIWKDSQGSNLDPANIDNSVDPPFCPLSICLRCSFNTL